MHAPEGGWIPFAPWVTVCFFSIFHKAISSGPKNTWNASYQPGHVHSHMSCLLAGFMMWHFSNREELKKKTWLHWPSFLQSLSYKAISWRSISHGSEGVGRSVWKQGQLQWDRRVCAHSTEKAARGILMLFSTPRINYNFKVWQLDFILQLSSVNSTFFSILFHVIPLIGFSMNSGQLPSI